MLGDRKMTIQELALQQIMKTENELMKLKQQIQHLLPKKKKRLK